MTDPAESPAPVETRRALPRPKSGGVADAAALTAMYEEHREELFTFLIRLTRDRDAAEDTLQEAFIRLIREARAGRMPDEVRPWLFRVAANAAISRSRRSTALHRLLPRLVDRRQPVRPDEEALHVERRRDLGAALAELPPDARAALLLAARGFGGREIAQLIGRSEGATRTLMCRARREMRDRLAATLGSS